MISGHPLLRQAAEQAAKNAKFAPTMLSGQAVKVVGIITYNFAASGDANVSVGEISDEKVGEVPSEEAIRENRLKEKLHFWIFEVVNRLAKNEQTVTANEKRFVRDGKAEVQIKLLVKTSEVMEKLKNLGAEIISEKDAKTIHVKIPIDKLANLAEFVEIEYVLLKI